MPRCLDSTQTRSFWREAFPKLTWGNSLLGTFRKD